MMLGLPLLMGGLFERETTTVTELAVQGLDALPPELVALAEDQNAVLVGVPDADRRPFATTPTRPGWSLGPDFAERLAAGQVDVVIVTKVGNIRGELNAGKLRAAVDAYAQTIVAERLAGAGLDPSVLRPIAIGSADASTEAERSSGQLAWLIPFFIAIWTLSGGQMTAIDATAGEKERGTLEVLLVTPVRRAEVVVGKFLAVVTFGLSRGGDGDPRLRARRDRAAAASSCRMLGDGGGEIASMMGGTLTITPLTVLAPPGVARCCSRRWSPRCS